MSEYKKFLKHLGINPMLMKADMRSRLPDSEKPMLVNRCKECCWFYDSKFEVEK